jgi:type IV fimbrial biogenesis protein FimT
MMSRSQRLRGLTLIEIAIGIAILAALMAAAVPSFGERIARARLASAAEGLASDLAEARFEAAQSGRSLHLVFSPGANWCYAVARTPGCDCHSTGPCQLKVVRAADLPGVDLIEADDAAFDPTASEPAAGRALWRGMQGAHSLEVALTPLGRARVCSPSGLKDYAGC